MPLPRGMEAQLEPRQFGVILLAALAVAPSATAAWSVKGAWEPDTAWDAGGPFMWLEPDTGVSPAPFRVYFNGFGAPGPAGSSVNPNSALLGTSLHAAPFYPVALLGIWKDCNKDGYVGLGDTGALEYRAELLTDASVCPPTQPPPGREWLARNDGKWVVELAPIGYDDVTSAEDQDPLNLNDTQARVWADWGLPGAAPRLVCATYPTPYGTFRSTGGLLRWLDCQSGFRGARAVSDIAPLVGADDLSFADAPPDRPDQSGSTLNQPNPWGAERDDAIVHVFDCAAPTPLEVRDPTDPGDGTGRLHTLAAVPVGDSTVYLNASDSRGRIVNYTVFAPSPWIDPTGTPAGTVNETQAGITDCDRGDNDEMLDLDGRRGGSDAALPYALEGANEPVSPYAPRSRSDYAFSFEEGVRGKGVAAQFLGGRARDDLGLGIAALTGFWVGSGSSAGGPNAYASRETLGAEPVTVVTYYAHIAPHLVRDIPLSLRIGSGYGTYGFEGCSAGTVECDPARWWRNSAGQDVTPRDSRLGDDPGNPTVPADGDHTRIGVRIGQHYQLRDIDCLDASAHSARAAGAQWGVLTGTACPRP